MMYLARYLLILFLVLIHVPALAEPEPICLKIFGRPSLGVSVLCTMGWSAESIKKLKRQQEVQGTISYWCKENMAVISPKYRQLFKDHPVSYIVTFQGKSDIGTLHPTANFSEEAKNAALEIISKAPPLTTPPTDLPYQRGVLIRFSSLGMTVAIAPEKF